VSYDDIAGVPTALLASRERRAGHVRAASGSDATEPSAAPAAPEPVQAPSEQAASPAVRTDRATGIPAVPVTAATAPTAPDAPTDTDQLTLF